MRSLQAPSAILIILSAVLATAPAVAAPAAGRCVAADGKDAAAAQVIDGQLRLTGDDRANQVWIYENADHTVLTIQLDQAVCTFPVAAGSRPALGNQPFNMVLFELKGGNDRVRTGVDAKAQQQGNGQVMHPAQGYTVSLGAGNDDFDGSALTMDLEVDGGPGRDKIRGGAFPLDDAHPRHDVIITDEKFTGGAAAKRSPDTVSYRLHLGVAAEAPQGDSVSDITMDRSDRTIKLTK
jgi:hypothetical protein